MPAKKVSKKKEVENPAPAPVQPEPAPAPTSETPAAPAVVQPVAAVQPPVQPQPAVAVQPTVQPAADAAVKPELVKENKIEPEKDETPNLDGWVAVKDILPQGQTAKSTLTAGSYILVGLLFGMAIGGGAMWWWDSKARPIVANQANSIAKELKKTGGSGAASPSVTPTTTAVSRSTIKLLVQNGSGVKGAASVAADVLTKLGYTIVGTGNAKGGPYTESTLNIKKDKDEISKLLLEDLAADYQIAKTLGVLEESATYDAVLIVGKK